MATIDSLSPLSTQDLLGGTSTQTKNKSTDQAFADVLKKSISEVNEYQKVSEKAMADMATGQVKDLHQAAMAIGKAETSMKLMLEVRSKALSAYKEILKTQM
jgi:flagellar hook-basal body complex protein FliE